MHVPTRKLEGTTDIHAFFRDYQSRNPCGCWWFRGHADKEWQLAPKAGRDEFCLPSLDGLQRDIYRFREWQKRVVAYNDRLPPGEWECLAIAQHHGLATRLLDWTENPLVAVYFACCEKPSSDGCVYCYSPPAFVEEGDTIANMKATGTGYSSRGISPRILNQRGVFTVHNPPEEPIEPTRLNKLTRLELPAHVKWDLLLHLNDYGINSATLFPGMDGLSEYINFETQDRVRWAKRRT